ncbi:2-hydroxyacid dehydrogenase [Botrimarina hoheduenensis]|uniref:D-lactate dehydrogenase n=1 Tax=Botrimarina hoheduenensis TaxID=2528000 RepID=A0A5C5VR04_9BACT|nr:2-hydroxyacid dehydrogenase [Botrimarina hoheduenensis]TWT40241.1 D-lactate dehydrogenase [Botrimarina hoheduenensis]
MKIAVFSTKPYDQRFLEPAAKEHGHELTFFETRLTADTVGLAEGNDGVCVFVNDQLNHPVMIELAALGARHVALRCAGYNNIDLNAAKKLGVRVVRVPAYSPHAVAEHAVGLILALNRNLHRAYGRVRDGDFRLEGLLGFDLVSRTVGVVGTGRIGWVFAQIVRGFGCRVLAYDTQPRAEGPQAGIEYAPLETVLTQSEIVSLHCPLTPETHHLIDDRAIERMRAGVMIINTSRGAVIDTPAVIRGLKSGKIGHLGLDVYEEEADIFFEDLSDRVLSDDVLARLLTFPNVLITGHQAFFTSDALHSIAETTMSNLSQLERADTCPNELLA